MILFIVKNEKSMMNIYVRTYHLKQSPGLIHPLIWLKKVNYQLYREITQVRSRYFLIWLSILN